MNKIYVSFEKSSGEKAAVRSLLSYAVRKETGRPYILKKDKKGKPHLLGSGLYVSLSHSRGAVAVALSEDCQIGVDIEKIDRSRIKVLQRFFKSESEDISYLTELWCEKESYGKMTGEGIFDETSRPCHYFTDEISVDGDVYKLVLCSEKETTAEVVVSQK